MRVLSLVHVHLSRHGNKVRGLLFFFFFVHFYVCTIHKVYTISSIFIPFCSLFP